MKSYFWTNNMK